MLSPLPVSSARDHAVRFARDVVTPADANTPVADLQPAYLDWCRATDTTPFPTREIGLELANLFNRAGVEIIDIGGMKYVSRAKIKAGRVLGPMTTIGVQA